ncbi:hypothetical protein [Ochrobactrum sp. MYb379]|uniref:hypothetical protein n=1 Tax=Ochrobactrum sp. MYb379 TaxID=2745275 RepID=UPI0030A506F1
MSVEVAEPATEVDQAVEPAEPVKVAELEPKAELPEGFPIPLTRPKREKPEASS